MYYSWISTHPLHAHGYNKANSNNRSTKAVHPSCAGTGGHTESVRIYGNDVDEHASGTGYVEDGDTLTFDSSFTLEAGKINTHKIETGSYPQIPHTKALQAETGWLNCTSFVDANGKEYDDWIPAIKLG